MSNLGKVLLADASKVIRVSLARELSGHFEVREESSGESAWQSLVLDHSIVAVVSGINLNRLDGLALVERLRESKLPRLNRLPFFLVVPDSFSDEERAKARSCGVNEFISRDSASASLESIVAALVERLSGVRHEGTDVDQTLVSTLVEESEETPEDVGVRTDVGISDIMGQMGGMAGLEADEGKSGGDSEGTEDVVLAREMLEERLGQLLTAAPDGWGVGVLAFSLDGYDDLVRKYGIDLATRTVQKFSFLLARKIRSEDSIGQLAQGKVMIVAPATTRAICTGFANRICKAMTSAQISVRGQQVDLTVSVGIAVAPEDGVEISVQELLDLAESRLAVAKRTGGNRVVADSNAVAAQVSNDEFLAKLKELLGTTDPAQLSGCIGQVGLQLMPLLKQMDASFRLGLPLDDMNKRLWDRARAERMT
ncbi:diguanylate cyclase domain-containing protein [Azonexus sp. IMCC34839]|uniref:GGDEF domain-containing response regulator n=1 Tax=Azonexus sp. IMCC34839 TaxID=3133695 RepID=UPI00399BE95A